jgi:hypothetical protein
MIAIPFGEKLSLIPVASPDYTPKPESPTPRSRWLISAALTAVFLVVKVPLEFIGPSGEQRGRG